MDKLLQGWFNASRHGVAFVVPNNTSQGETSGFCYQLVNASFARLVNRTPDELIGQPVSGLLAPEREENLVRQLLTVSQTGEEQILEEPTRQADKKVWLQITLTRLNEAVQISVQSITRQENDRRQRRMINSLLTTISGWVSAANADELDAHIIDALSQLGRYSQADRVAMFSYNGDDQPGRCMAEWCADGVVCPENDRLHQPQTKFSWLNHQLANGTAICLTTSHLAPEASPEKLFLESMSAQSMLAVPLIRNSQMTGFLGFFTVNQPTSWSDLNTDLLRTIGILLTDLTVRLQQQTTVKHPDPYSTSLIDQALAGPHQTDLSPLAIVLKQINYLIPCERLRVFRINEATIEATVECQFIDGIFQETPAIWVVPYSFYTSFLQRQQGGYIPYLQPETPGIPPELQLYEQGIRSLLIIPLYRRQKCLGAFTLASFTPGFFTEEHFKTARKAAAPVALLLYQNYLSEKQQRHTQQLEQRVNERTLEIEQLSTLHQAILKHAGQAILSTDIRGVIQTSNQACETLLGYQADELIGLVIRIDPGSPPDKHIPRISCTDRKSLGSIRNHVALMLTTQRYFQEECVALSKDGRHTPILLTISALQDDDGTTIGYVGIATDIAALKTAEAKFQQKNKELDTFFNGALGMHCISDAQGKLLKVNQAFQTVLGYSEDELISIPFLYLLHPDEQKYVYQHLLAVIVQQPVDNQINRFRRKDGTYRIIEWNAIAIDNVVYGSARDITERQQTENQLRNLNQRLQLATRAAGQGIWESDLEQGTLLWDDRMWEMHGLKPGRTNWRFDELLSLVHPDDRPGFLARSQENLRGDTANNVSRIIQPDGTVRYIESNGLIARNEQGLPSRAIGVAWDVTERKLAEESLRESEQRFREIAENVDEVFWVHSADPFRLIYVNAAYERVWNYSRQSLLDDHNSFLNAVLAEDQPAVLDFLDQYQAGIEGQLNCRIYGPAQSIRWISIRTFVIRNEAGAATRHIGIANNITSQKEQELILQKSLHREQELNQLKSQFVATASHEFRTPLATIQSSVDLIKLYLDLPKASARQSVNNHLGVIEREIEKFGDLLTDMLTIGKIEAGKVSFRPHWADVVAVCESVITTHFSNRADRRTVVLRVEGNARNVWIDDNLMSHVIVNLLSNAFKFSQESPCLHLLFTVDRLQIEVIDTGIGIPEKDHGTLFQAFSRASNTAGIPGTGLGLVIARQFIDLHEGQIRVQSEQNKGTTFTITLSTGVPSQSQPTLADGLQPASPLPTMTS